MNKKAQISGAGIGIIGLFLIISIVGILQLVSIVTTSKVAASVEDQIPLADNQETNESVTITMNTGADNSTRLSENGFVTNSDRIANATNYSKVLVRGTDYSISLNGPSGAIATSANLTLLKNVYNATEVKVTYETKERSAFHTTNDAMRTTNLDSFELGSTGQIVLAATVILAAVFGMILFLRGK